MTLEGWKQKLINNYPEITGESFNALCKWFRYKKCRINPMSFRGIIEDWQLYCEKYSESICCRVVKESISRGYKGIAWGLPKIEGWVYDSYEKITHPTSRYNDIILDSLLINISEDDE